VKGATSSASIVVRLAKVVEIVLDSVGLTPNQYRMLTLVDAGAPPMRELSVRLVMKPPNITTLVDGLVARGYVARGRSETDRRRQVLRLTTRGRRVLRDAESRSAKALERLAAMDPHGGSHLTDGLDDWLPALDEVASQLHLDLLVSGARKAS
jgi:DNA-binding MarR family transcriptional regulator